MKKTTILFSLLFLLFSMKAFSEENTGCFQVIIGPEACQSDFSYWISNIGGWSAYFPSGHVICNISPGQVDFRFRPVSGWDVPENMNITVEANKTSLLDIYCCPIQPVQPIITSIGQGVSTEGFSIQWMEDRCDVTYQIFRSLNYDLNSKVMIADNVEEHSYTNTTAIPGKEYYYLVRAKNEHTYSNMNDSHYAIGYRKLNPPNIIAST